MSRPASAPLLFIHYGPASYLRTALRHARMTNPEKRIVLLGDNTNRALASGIVEHVDFECLSGGDKELEFGRVFQVIQGERHRFNKRGGVDFWLRFVFRRWFLIERFLERENIDAFWTFDSDTLLLAPLAPREARFARFEGTTQCMDRCLNGWVGSSRLVSSYTSSILDQFRDESFLNAQRERLKSDVGLAFNEMDAFHEFRRKGGINTWHAAEPLEGEAFDDALAFTDGFVESEERVLGKTRVKQLWSGSAGALFCRKGDEWCRLLTCNMSWMPDFLWSRLGRHALPEGLDHIGICPKNTAPISFRQPLNDKLRSGLKSVLWKLQSKVFSK